MELSIYYLNNKGNLIEFVETKLQTLAIFHLGNNAITCFNFMRHKNPRRIDIIRILDQEYKNHQVQEQNLKKYQNVKRRMPEVLKNNNNPF